MVTIDADDAVWIDGEEDEVVSELDLRKKLRTARDEHEKDAMMINVAADSSHGKFVMVLDAGADAGMTEILFTAPGTDEEGSGG